MQKTGTFRLMLGLNHRTSAYQVILAAYEAICFQTRDLIEAFVKDVPAWKNFDRITVGGEFSENPFLLQLLADLCGVKVERPQTTFPSCFGAMIAAGLTMDILTLEQSAVTFAPPIEIFQPTMCSSSKFTFFRFLRRHRFLVDFSKLILQQKMSNIAHGNSPSKSVSIGKVCRMTVENSKIYCTRITVSILSQNLYLQSIGIAFMCFSCFSVCL